MWLPVFILLEAFLLTGCEKNGPIVVLTTGFEEDVVFKIEDETCTKAEIMVYLVNSENVYDEVFGEKIWTVPYGDGDVEDQYKESILARLAQIKAMNIFARDKGIELDETEEENVKQAAKAYFNSLTSEEINYMGVSLEIIEKLYREYALANKLYENITGSVNPEISDDEARTVTIRSILIKTYSMDKDGNRIEFTPEQKDDAMRRAYELSARINAGEEFEIIAADYNEDEKTLYSFSRGVMPEAIEEVAFNMSEDEVSDVICTEYGYHIIKCITNFDEEQTDLHKLDIVEARKEEAFTRDYDEYISSLTSNINMDLWNDISYERTANVKTSDFFEIYELYVENQ